jgi:hypothetical protein
MATITTTQSFTTGDQVTAGTLNGIATNSAFDTSVVDDSSTALTTNASGTANSRIIVKDGGITSAKLNLTDGITVSKTGTSVTLAAFNTTQGGNSRGLSILTPVDADGGSPFVFNTGNAISFEIDDDEILHIKENKTVEIKNSGTTHFRADTDGTSLSYFQGPGNGANIELYGGSHSDGGARMNIDTNNLFLRKQDGSDVYPITGSSSANLFMASNGQIQKSTSSSRYKKNIKDYDKGIESVKQLRPVSFQSIANDEDKTYAGFIAEEVHDSGLIEFVDYNKEGQPEALHYANMTAILTKALQETLTKIESLEARVAALES